MPIPLFVWGGIAAVSFIAGSATTVAVTDTVDDFGDAAVKVGNATSQITKAALLLGTAYVAYQYRETILQVLK